MYQGRVRIEQLFGNVFGDQAILGKTADRVDAAHEKQPIRVSL